MNVLEIFDRQLTDPVIKPVRPSMTLHPSAASIKVGEEVLGSCNRKEYWRIKGMEASDPDTPQAITKMELGNACHEMVERIFRGARMVDAAECDIWIPEHHVHGRVDLILADDPNHNKIGVEVKSVWGYNGAKRVIAPDRGVMEPKVEHVLQSMIYLAFYARYGMEEWILFYISRDNGVKNQHTLRLANNDGIISVVIKPGLEGEPTAWPHITLQGIFQRFDELWGCTESETLPPRDFTLQYSKVKLEEMLAAGDLNKGETAMVGNERFVEKGDWQCSYCRYKRLCWEGVPQNELWDGSRTKDD